MMRYLDKRKTVIGFLVFFGMWYVFLNASPILTSHYSILWPMITCLSVIISLPYLRKYLSGRLSKILIWYVLFLVSAVFSLFISQDFDSSKSYIVHILLVIVFSFSIFSNSSNYSIFFGIVKLFTFFLLVVSYIELLIPSVYENIFLPLLNNQQSYYVHQGIYRTMIRGFNYSSTQNALWMTVCFSVFLSSAVCNRHHRLRNIFISLLAFIIVFSTGKRSYSLIAIVMIVWVLSVIVKNENYASRLFNTGLILVGLFLLFFVLVRFVPVLNNSFVKTVSLIADGDISNGRGDLVAKAIELIKENFLGIGVDATLSVMGEQVHNSYIQLVLELGVLGGMLSIPAFLFPLLISIKYARSILLSEGIDTRIKNVFMFGVMFQMVFSLSALVAIPIQWPRVVMVNLICQLITISIIELE